MGGLGWATIQHDVILAAILSNPLKPAQSHPDPQSVSGREERARQNRSERETNARRAKHTTHPTHAH